jgi:hypothetical protein
MKIVLTPQESEEYFFNALCSLDYICSGYYLELIYDERLYVEAKKVLQKEKPDAVICYEEVLMQLLRLGGGLNLYDHNDEQDNIIVLEDVHERVATTQLNHLMDMIEERGDAITDDVILQTVFLGEIIFG